METRYLFPVFLSVAGKRCLIVGGGGVATRKARDLARADALVTVVAPVPSGVIEAMSGEGTITLLERPFEPDDLDGAFIVFAATDDRGVNASIARLARERGILVNAVDDPPACDFYSGAVVNRGPLTIAVSTSGTCPGIAREVRTELERLFPDSWADYLETAGGMRDHARGLEGITDDVRRTALSWISGPEMRDIFFDTGKDEAWRRFMKIISSS